MNYCSPKAFAKAIRENSVRSGSDGLLSVSICVFPSTYRDTQILSYRDELLNARMPATPNGHAALRALAQILSYREGMLNAFFYFSANEYL